MKIHPLQIDRYILIIALLGLYICFYGYLDPQSQNLVAHDEGLYVGRARMLLQSNDWFTPFEEAHHKTIGSYWLIA